MPWSWTLTVSSAPPLSARSKFFPTRASNSTRLVCLEVSVSPEIQSYNVTANSMTLAALAAALSAAQGEITAAAKDSDNPYFRSRYADLASIWDACRAPLARNGLSIIQCPTAEGARVTVHTTLLHSSGEYVTSSLAMTSMRQLKDGGGWEKVESPQAVGSTITYARRYALAAMVGVAPDDDDGEAAQGRGAPPPHRPPVRPIAAAMKPPAERFAQRADTIAAKAEQVPLPIAATAPAPWGTRPIMEAAFEDVHATVGDQHYFYILQVHSISVDLHGTANKLREAYSVLKLRAAEIATGVEGTAV